LYAGPMTAVMDRPTAEFTSGEATRIATANPPSAVALTVFLGIFTVTGFVIGRSWFYLAKVIAITYLAARYGYRQGLRVPVEIPQPSPVGPSSPM
jgi:hypothetical protein